jgi:hypothetical protein
MDSIVIPFSFLALSKGCLLIFHADALPEEGGKGINWPIRLGSLGCSIHISLIHPSSPPPQKAWQAERGLAFRGVGFVGIARIRCFLGQWRTWFNLDFSNPLIKKLNGNRRRIY